VNSITIVLLMTSGLLSSPTRDLLTTLAERSAASRIRSYAQFACEELIIPEGKHRGERFRYQVQPWTRLLHEAIDSGRWNRVALVACVQMGKSLQGYVLPGLKHLFEDVESVVLAAPSMEVCKTKYRDEILPAILANPRFRRHLPDSGAGSRGGVPDEIVFKNGAHLKFMASHGGDEARSSYTTRVVIATEVDKMDRPSSLSREASPVRQIEARAASYDEQERRTYLECTVSIEDGAIWQEYLQGTHSRIVCQCPGCEQWSTPERQSLQGWQQADTVFDARQEACWVCPQCGVIWDDADRRRMNEQAELLHDGQSIDASGRISGEPRPTDTLGFRANAFNNLFWSTPTIAAAEWRALRAVDEESAEREACQFRWVVPHEPPQLDLTPLDPQKLRRRRSPAHPRGLVPTGTEYLTVGLDLGKRVGWWVAIAWRPGPRAHLVDYGTLEIPSDDLGVEIALAGALREFRERVEETGWLTPDGARRIPDQVWIDAKYQSEIVYDFVRHFGHRYRPTLGYGAGQQTRAFYNRPKRTGASVKHIGEGYHVAWLPKWQVFVVEVNADHWKSFLHERLAVPIDPCVDEVPAGAMTFYDSADANEHITLIKHLTAERATEEIVEGKGRVVKWVHEGRRANHFLDAGYLACAAAHLCGVRIARPAEPPRTVVPRRHAPPATALGPGWRPPLASRVFQSRSRR